MLEAELMAFGLTPRQIKIYLTLLKLQEASARLVGEQASLPRLTAYSILERLTSMGLVSVYQKRQGRIYHVNPPESLLYYCDHELNQIQNKRDRLKRCLPRLKSSYGGLSSKIPLPSASFHFYHDRILFENLCRGALKSETEWWVLHEGLLWPLLSSLRHQVVVKPRCLLSSRQRSRLSPHLQGVDVRYVPERLWRGPLNIFVLCSKLYFVFDDSHQFFGLEIDHRPTAEQVRNVVRMLWEMVE